MRKPIPVLPLEKPCDTYPIIENVAETRNEPTRILLRVLQTLERADLRYCVLYGYEDFSIGIKSDVDCIIDANIAACDLLALFHQNRNDIGAQVVQCWGYYFVFASRNIDGSPCFLALDFSIDCNVEDLPLYDGEEILATRRRSQQLYIPAPHVEFGICLTRSIAKQTLNDERGRRLSRLFRQDPDRCLTQVARHWNVANATLIQMAASSDNWGVVRARFTELRQALRRRAISRRPARFAANKLLGVLRRGQRLLWPAGMSVAFLGPDGAGKSSVVEAIGPKLADVFPRWHCLGFAPGLLSWLRRGRRSTSEPHSRPPRSLPVSVVRLAYWCAYQAFEFVQRYFATTRSTLILYDRHLLDSLVDQKRYRYGGPVGLLRLLYRAVPKPDLVILLDASPEILQARKQEVPFEVTVSQRDAYLTLIQTLPNGHIVNASLSRARVDNAVAEIILRWAAERVVRRHVLQASL